MGRSRSDSTGTKLAIEAHSVQRAVMETPALTTRQLSANPKRRLCRIDGLLFVRLGNRRRALQDPTTRDIEETARIDAQELPVPVFIAGQLRVIISVAREPDRRLRSLARPVSRGAGLSPVAG